jgi:SpoVK/Ycf46/Vps4 family AAA+-type ATPase
MSDYPFYSTLARTLNSGKSRSVVLWGNIYDLFRCEDEYTSLVDYVLHKTKVKGVLQLVYELNGPIRMEQHIRARIKQIWDESYVAKGSRETFEEKLLASVGRPAVALELLRQITMACRDKAKSSENLLIIIEAADMMIPSGANFSSLNAADRRCVCIAKDWFSDPKFVMGRDSVILLSESTSEIHPNVARLPQMSQIEVPSPDVMGRALYIDKMNCAKIQSIIKVDDTCSAVSGVAMDLAKKTAGLTLQAVRQILCDKTHNDDDIFEQVERFIKSQVGEDTIEFKKPEHSLDDVMGNTRLKRFISEELIPRFQSTGSDALSGAAVGGPIGSGKSFIFEAVAAEIGCPVIVLKNLRSQYFGQTDVVFERLRRVLESIGKVLIFVDEADTQFGKVSGDGHATEKRLTGKIQAMMSDPKLKGQVVWLLMTARIHLLSPDIRRPGRVGDLIIPVLDPEGEDRLDFARWCLSGLRTELPQSEDTDCEETFVTELHDRAHIVVQWKATEGYSAAAWAGLKSSISAKNPQTLSDVKDIVWDMIQPNIAEEREYQKLQALLNCTRKVLLPSSLGTRQWDGPGTDEYSFSMTDLQRQWRNRIQDLEKKGLR